MMMGFFVEAVVIALLIATCGYCFMLNRRLQALKTGQVELARSIETFDGATRRAEKNLKLMEKAGLSNERDLQGLTSRAQALANELSVMISSGDKIADRIESTVGDVRRLGGAKVSQVGDDRDAGRTAA